MPKRGHCYPGLLISFIGVEGSGKSTQRERLENYLTNQKLSVVACTDPQGTFRKLLLDPRTEELHPKAELLLFMASRSELVEKKVKPTLRKGGVVLYEQYIDASIAYQGYGLGLPLDVIEKLNAFATDNIRPDLTFLFDIEPETANVTTTEFGKRDKIEARRPDFHERVRKGYYEIAKQEERFRIIPYNEGDIERTQQQVRDEVERYVRIHNLQLHKNE